VGTTPPVFMLFLELQRKGGSSVARSGHSPFVPTSHLPGTSTSPPLFRNERRLFSVDRGPVGGGAHGVASAAAPFSGTIASSPAGLQPVMRLSLNLFSS